MAILFLNGQLDVRRMLLGTIYPLRRGLIIFCFCAGNIDKRLRVAVDEGEPGTFKDRQIFQYDPHLLIEGIICTCYAINAHHAYIYIRGEYKFFSDRVNEAIKEA